MSNRTSSDTSAAVNALRALEGQRQAHVAAGTQPPAALLGQLSKTADTVMAETVAKHGRD
jgi:hypothetical protein